MTPESKPPRAHRFRLEIGGTVMVGLAFASERDLEEWLSGRDLAPLLPCERDTDQLIDDAIAALSGRTFRSLAAHAREVQRGIAQHVGPDDLPSVRTIERRLTEVRQNLRQSASRDTEAA